MKRKAKRSAKSKEVSEGVLQAVGRILPGFHGLFKKMERSKTFGSRISEIRKEIGRRFGGKR